MSISMSEGMKDDLAHHNAMIEKSFKESDFFTNVDGVRNVALR